MGTVQVMALNSARKGNMGRLNSYQPLYVYDTLIAQPWLKGVIAQIRGEKAIPGVDAGDEKAVKKAKRQAFCFPNIDIILLSCLFTKDYSVHIRS